MSRIIQAGVCILYLVYVAAAVITNVCELSGSDLFYHWTALSRYDQSCTVAIVTYATTDSFGYSAFSVAINSIYAQVSGYRMMVLDDDMVAQYETATDPRWNKISILRSALHPQNGWARECEYIMWLDSDLIVLDVTMDITAIGARYPHADVIMSKDIETAPFVSNSGAILVRNTDWARALLSMWWSTFDRDRCCDQNAFTWLYDRDSPSDIKSKTALLPVDTINTDFPAWKNQRPHNPVLHLAGLNSLYRTAVFKAGYETVCSALLGHDKAAAAVDLKQRVPDQLGLNKQYLFDVMRNMNQLRTIALDDLHSESQGCNCDFDRAIEVSSVLESNVLADVGCPAQQWRRRLEDVLKFDDDEKTHYTKADLVALAALRDKEVVVRERVHCNLVRSASELTLANSAASQLLDSDVYLCLEAVKDAASTGFEFVIALKIAALDRERAGITGDTREYARKGQLALNRIMQLMDAALLPTRDRLPSPIKGTFHYYKFKTLQLMAGALQHGHNISSDPPTSILLLSQAAHEWEEMISNNYHGTNYVSADPDKEYAVVLSELALLLCLDSKYELGLRTFSKVIRLQQKIILGYSSIRIATEDIANAGKVSLCEAFANYGQCAMSSKNSGIALEISLVQDDDLHALDECRSASNDYKRTSVLNFLRSSSSVHHGTITKRKLKKKA